MSDIRMRKPENHEEAEEHGNLLELTIEYVRTTRIVPESRGIR